MRSTRYGLALIAALRAHERARSKICNALVVAAHQLVHDERIEYRCGACAAAAALIALLIYVVDHISAIYIVLSEPYAAVAHEIAKNIRSEFAEVSRDYKIEIVYAVIGLRKQRV